MVDPIPEIAPEIAPGAPAHSTPATNPAYRRRGDPLLFYAEIIGLMEEAFDRGHGFPGAVRAVHRRLPNMAPADFIPYAEWLLAKLRPVA